MPRHFDNWLEAYIEYTKPLESPAVFHYWAGISTIAGALRRKVWFDQEFFLWSPNFYIVLVAPPGIAAKSVTVNIGKQLLRQIDGIHFGPNALTWQALVKDMAAANQAYPMGDGDDLIEDEYLSMSCITISSGELGSLLNPNDREMIDVLTDLWDSRMDSWKKSTVTQGKDEIKNPWINIIACTTPAWLIGNIPRHMIEAGFFSRVAFIYAEQKRHHVAYPGFQTLPRDHEKREQQLVEDLQEIARLKGRYRLTHAGQHFGEAWYAEHERRVASNDPALTRLGTYVSRRQTHLHKIAMVLSAAKRSDLLLTEDDMKESAAHLDEIEKHMHHIYSLAGSEKNIANTNAVVEILRKRKRMSRDMCFRMVCTRMGYQEFQEALTDGVMAKRVARDGNQVIYTDEDEESET